MVPGVKERFDRLSELVKIHILTADTHNRAETELRGLKCELHMVSGQDQDIQKETYIRKLDADRVIAIGNGVNDKKMLEKSRIGIAVCLQEGLAIDALKGAKILTYSILDALDLLLLPNRLKATLRN
jgi:soluble P-type ATPase